MQVSIPVGDGLGTLMRVLEDDIILLSELFKRLNGQATEGDPLARWRRRFFVRDMLPESFSWRIRERLKPALPAFGSAELIINDEARPGPPNKPYVSLILRAEKDVSVLITDTSIDFALESVVAPKSPPLRVRAPYPPAPPVRSFLEELLSQQ